MRIVFMGTPDFAAASLNRLIEERFEVVGVFTQPDKPRGRGMKVSFSPVKELALSAGIPVFQPEKMRDGMALAQLQELKPDLLVVVAYGRILPDDILAVPRLGAINVHASLLPQHRGSAPIQWAILNGDRETGVTIMYLASELDAGDIIYTDKTEIGEFETAGELFDRLRDMGAELLIRAVRDIGTGTAPRTPQDASQATFTTMLDKSMSPINWNKAPREIIKQICGLQPWPVATAELGGVSFKIFSAAYTGNQTQKCPGTVLAADKTGIEVACANGDTLLITALQAPGGRRMAAGDYLRGHPMSVEG
jgi:methionyl-tRNA formyltransferase